MGKMRLEMLVLLWLAFFLSPALSDQDSMMDELSVMSVSEECGKWRISFNWSDMDEYKSSVSHGDSASGKTEVATDTLILSTSTGAAHVLKLSVITYSKSDPSQVSMSAMANLANSTLVKSGVCDQINLAVRMIDGQQGIFASGLKCPTNEPVYAAVYPVEYHLDRPGGVLESNAIGAILSTYNLEVTERFVSSVDILQVK
jgi:hypothetical protein